MEKTKAEILAEAGYVPRGQREKLKMHGVCFPSSVWDSIPDIKKGRWIRELVEKELAALALKPKAKKQQSGDSSDLLFGA